MIKKLTHAGIALALLGACTSAAPTATDPLSDPSKSDGQANLIDLSAGTESAIVLLAGRATSMRLPDQAAYQFELATNSAEIVRAKLHTMDSLFGESEPVCTRVSASRSAPEILHIDSCADASLEGQQLQLVLQWDGVDGSDSLDATLSLDCDGECDAAPKPETAANLSEWVTDNGQDLPRDWDESADVTTETPRAVKVIMAEQIWKAMQTYGEDQPGYDSWSPNKLNWQDIQRGSTFYRIGSDEHLGYAAAFDYTWKLEQEDFAPGAKLTFVAVTDPGGGVEHVVTFER